MTANQLAETYNRIAPDWHNDHSKDTWWQEGTNELVALLPRDATVLDVGCGSGVKSEYLSKFGFHMVGIDFSEKLLEIAARNVPGISTRVMDMRDVPKLTDRFDAVFSQASVLHIPRKEACGVLSGFVSVLKPRGLLYVAVKQVMPGRPLEEVRVENDYGYEYTRFFSYYTMDDLRGYMNALGLKIISERSTPAGNTTWLQIIGRKP